MTLMTPDATPKQADKQVPNIDERLTALSDAISQVDDSIGRLITRIAPVLGPDTPSPTSPDEKDDITISAVAERIDSATKWLYRMHYGLNGITQRVEL